MADALCIPAELLIPATPELLTDWCGPVWWSGRLWASLGAFLTPDGPVVTLAPLAAASVLAPLTHADLHEVRMPLARAEVRDRVVRVLASRLGHAGERPEVLLTEDGYSIVVGDVLDADGHMYVWDRNGNPARVGRVAVPALVAVPSLADLDPTDDTRLPDGSRRVDAVALGRVWLEVCGG